MQTEITQRYRFGPCSCGNLLVPYYALIEERYETKSPRYFRVINSLTCPYCGKNEPIDNSFDVEISKSTFVRLSKTLNEEMGDYIDKTFRVIVAGSRDFRDYNLLCKYMDKCLSHKVQERVPIEIVSGRASGADSLGEQYAEQHGYDLVYFPAKWKMGRTAGFVRNKQMADYADALVAFWDGQSRGTKHMIETAQKNKLKTRVIRVP